MLTDFEHCLWHLAFDEVYTDKYILEEPEELLQL